MAITSDSATIGDAFGDTQAPSFLPRLVSKIQRRRIELGEGQWLYEELRIALEEMTPLLERGKVTYEVVRGFKNTVVIKPVRSGGLGTGTDIEAYSIKMMASCLKNPSNQFLSLTLEPDCREARRTLIGKLSETCQLLMDPQGNAKRVKDRDGPPDKAVGTAPEGAKEPAFLAALRERKQDERRARLLASVLEMTTAAAFRQGNEATFWRIFDSVWEQVKGGSVPESIAAGKILDRIYAERRARAETKATVPEPVAESLPEPVREPVPEPVQEPEPVQLPAILDNWVGQGLTAHRVFRDLQKTSDIRTQVRRWGSISGASSDDVEYLFILQVLNSIGRFDADGETVTVTVPKIPKMGFAEFEKRIDEGKAKGIDDIDPRIWGVIGGVYSFLKNWLGPQLRQPP